MHVLIVTNHFWPESFRINDLALGLRERGHEVSVLTAVPDYPDGKFYKGYGVFRRNSESYHGISIKRVPLIPRGSGSKLRLVLNFVSLAITSCLMAPLLFREHYDLILVFESSPVTVGLPAVLLKKLRSIPIFFWVQDLWPESLTATRSIGSPKIIRLIDGLVTYIYRNCDRILIQSTRFRSSIADHGYTNEKIEYFPNSVEEVFKPVRPDRGSAEAALMPQGFIVMFAGNIGAAQSFATIIEAARKLKVHPDIHWVVLGDGRMRRWVENQVAQYSLQGTFHLLGRFPLESMPRFFALADVMLVSLSRDPIFSMTIPSKIQSYLACARPVVASLDGEGSRIIAESGAGIACPAEDAGALAKAVLAMRAMDPEERESMGERGRKYCSEHFDRQMLLDRLEGWMNEMKKEFGCEDTDSRWRRHAGSSAAQKSVLPS